MKLTLHASGLTASESARTLSGTIVRYGVPGRTSAGLLTVRAGALSWPADATRVKLTHGHDREAVTGYLEDIADDGEQVTGTFKVRSGPLGDEALTEATEKVRDGLSVDLIEAEIDGDEITSATVIAVGHVTFPAYDDSRITDVAANHNDPDTGEPAMPKTIAAPATEATPEPVTAADDTAPATAPAGVPVTASATVVNEPSPLARFTDIVASLAKGNTSTDVLAALEDITHSAHTDDVAPESWSGELWSGLTYVPRFKNLLNSGPLTHWKGKGWRWTTKPEVDDYEGNKAPIPSNEPATEPSDYEAARIAAGWDIDRKFYDFPDAAFLASFFAAVREDYAYKTDMKALEYITDAAVEAPEDTQTSLLKAAARARKHVKRNTRGAQATFLIVNDDDFDTLLDVTEKDVPAFLDLWGIDPRNFVETDEIPAGTLFAGVRQAATFRELGGASPIRVDAQNLRNGGIDSAFFGYCAVEEHHPSGIVSIEFEAPVDNGNGDNGGDDE